MYGSFCEVFGAVQTGPSTFAINTQVPITDPSIAQYVVVFHFVPINFDDPTKTDVFELRLISHDPSTASVLPYEDRIEIGSRIPYGSLKIQNQLTLEEHEIMMPRGSAVDVSQLVAILERDSGNKITTKVNLPYKFRLCSKRIWVWTFSFSLKLQ